MNEYSIVVDFQKGNIYTDLSVLVQNDYNAYKLNFEFDKEFERALFKLKYPVDNKEWVQDIVDNKLILPVLKDTGDYEYEISIYSEDGRLTGYATEKFHVRSELINTDEEVVLDDRLPILDNLIEEVSTLTEETDNLNIDAEKNDNVTTITITRKDGTTKNVLVLDGEKGDKGEKGEPGQSGSGSYNDLTNIPQINNVELIGNKTSDELNIQRKGNYANTKVTNREIDNLFD